MTLPIRKGYRATAVQWIDGKPRVTQWERIDAAPEPEPDPEPVVARGALAVERQSQADLFG